MITVAAGVGLLHNPRVSILVQVLVSLAGWLNNPCVKSSHHIAGRYTKVEVLEVSAFRWRPLS